VEGIVDWVDLDRRRESEPRARLSKSGNGAVDARGGDKGGERKPSIAANEKGDVNEQLLPIEVRVSLKKIQEKGR